MSQLHLKEAVSRSSCSSVSFEPVPSAYNGLFKKGISHPELYLWDAWSAREGGKIHLYCLAVSNKDQSGEPFLPQHRNQKPFHIRHFISTDNGETWSDQGSFQSARTGSDVFDSKSIWSGSVLSLPDGRQLMAYTGIREKGEILTFLQSLGLSVSTDWNSAIPESQRLISDPYTGYNSIVRHGYYLGDIESLGHKDGEGDGPILAWRDPFLLSYQGQLHMFWGAKLEACSPALGHAIVSETDTGFEITKLYPATPLPDGNEYTQLELPKVMHDHIRSRFLMLVATCNRIHESQSDEEADKRVRLYSSKNLDGPWVECGHNGSSLELAEPNMFGLTVIDADFDSQKLFYVAPYTETAGPTKFLTLSRTYCLEIGELGEGKAI